MSIKTLNEALEAWLVTEGRMIPVDECMPEMGVPVIGYNPDWIDRGSNNLGMRECFAYGDDTVEWRTATWVGCIEQYVTTDDRPTHWSPMGHSAQPRMSRPREAMPEGEALPPITTSVTKDSVTTNAPTKESTIPVREVMALLDRLAPRIDPNGDVPLNEDDYCCEHLLYQERERLHREFAAHLGQETDHE